MASLDSYLKKRGVTEDQMIAARRTTREVIDAYVLCEARKSQQITQVELAQAMGVSQNRISRMENGDLSSMTIDTIRRYIEALGGKLSITAELAGKDLVLL